MRPRVFFLPVLTLPLGDGTYRVAPGKPVEQLTMEQACQMTGLHPRDLRDGVEEGNLHAFRPAPRRWWFFAEELDAFLRFTMDHPDFWRNPKTRLLWRKSNPFKLPALPPSDGGRDSRPSQGDLFS